MLSDPNDTRDMIIRHPANILLQSAQIIKSHISAKLSSRNTMHGVSTTNTIDKKIQYKNKFGPQSKNLSAIIRGIKSAITVYSKKSNQEFSWQPRYFDHIIRTNLELNRIRKYIKENPQNWHKNVISH